MRKSEGAEEDPVRSTSARWGKRSWRVISYDAASLGNRTVNYRSHFRAESTGNSTGARHPEHSHGSEAGQFHCPAKSKACPERSRRGLHLPFASYPPHSRAQSSRVFSGARVITATSTRRRAA